MLSSVPGGALKSLGVEAIEYSVEVNASNIVVARTVGIRSPPPLTTVFGVGA